MSNKTFFLLIGLVMGMTFILLVGANKRHCVCNPAGCHWVNGLALGQTPAPDSQCGGAEKVEPTVTAMPRIPTATSEKPTAVKVEPSQTPVNIKIIITQPVPGVTPEKRVEPTATQETKTKITQVPSNKVDPKLTDPIATPCASCQCPDIRCSLATIAAAQATQAEFVSEMP